ncbi:MAG TPA: hypothetical protein VIX73_08160 [Kofleriaceae bacterium]|jgi:hypothetical protein
MIEADDRIEQALARLGSEYEPPFGWEARVLASTRASPPWWRYAVPGLAAGAVAVCAIALWPAEAPAFALSVEVQHPEPVRGREGQVGDLVRIAATGGAAERAIWVYRDGMLVLRCPGASSCAVSPTAIQVDFVPRQVGTYTVVALTARAALPVPAGDYDDAAAAVRRAGIEVREDRLTVR